jgi:hypothetical protein
MRKTSLLLPLAGLALVGCSTGGVPSTPGWTFGASLPPAAAQAALLVEVYKSPTCSCCHEWEAYLRTRGYDVRSIPTEDMARVKTDQGVPEAAFSCHTALIGGYVVEGHVPIEAIQDLLADRPAIDGIALPAMPPGSPGMPGDQAAPFEVLAIRDGGLSVFGEY